MDAIHEATGAGGGGEAPQPRARSVAAQTLPVLAVFLAVVAMHMAAGVGVLAALGGLGGGPVILTTDLLVTLAAVTSTIFLVVGAAAGMVSRAGLGPGLRLVRGRLGFGMILIAIFVFICLSQVADSALDLTGWSEGSILADMSEALREATGMTLVVAVLVIGVGGGLGEEVFFRGYMQTRLRSALGVWPAIFMTAAAFGLMHFDLVHTPVAFLFGILLGWLTEKAGSILPSIAAHVANNIMAVLGAALLPVSDTSTPHLALTAFLLPAGAIGAALIARRAPGFAPPVGGKAA